jgi:hypothetical protein
VKQSEIDRRNLPLTLVACTESVQDFKDLGALT